MSPNARHGWIVWVVLALAPRTSLAQSVRDDAPADVRMRFDTIVRGITRYALTATDNAASASDRYWRAVAMAPLQERATLDATRLYDGHIDAHLAAWGAIDLANPTGDGRIAGDLAVAWTRYRAGPVGVWGGRRFIPWGAPGGVHLDGLGGEVSLGGGFTADVVVGRPVTPTYGSLLGPTPGFDGTTAAGGARIGWTLTGRASSAISFLEHWAQGIPTRRVVQADVTATITRWLDLRAGLSVDLLGLGVMQAEVDVSAFPTRAIELDVGYGHTDPGLLIPRWSLLSVFVTRTWDEARARATWRIVPSVQVGVEGAVLRYSLAGREDNVDGPPWGSRLEAFARVTARDRRTQLLVMVSRRDDGARPMTLVRVAGSAALVRDLVGSVELASALDQDSFDAPRTSWYGRVSVDGPLATGWRLGASVDAVRSPVAASELRGFVHMTTRFELRGGGR